jgi:hypothetical protein
MTGLFYAHGSQRPRSQNVNAIAIASRMHAANISVATTSGRRIFADPVQVAPLERTTQSHCSVAVYQYWPRSDVSRLPREPIKLRCPAGAE